MNPMWRTYFSKGLVKNHQLENTCGIISSRKPWNRFWVQQGNKFPTTTPTTSATLRLQKHQRSGLSCPRVWHHCWCERRQVRCPIIWVVATQIFLDVSSHNMGKMNPIWRIVFCADGWIGQDPWMWCCLNEPFDMFLWLNFYHLFIGVFHTLRKAKIVPEKLCQRETS